MRHAFLLWAPLAIACGSSTSNPDSGVPNDSGGGGNDTSVPLDTGTTTSDAGLIKGGNPNGSCTSMTLPAEAKAADSSNPTTVVGTGTPDSCTQAALQTAVTKGGVVTFDCGKAPVTIALSATITVPYDKSTVIDGAGLVTLDGQNAVQILNWNSPNYKANDNSLTVQHMAFVNAKTNPVKAIPTVQQPSACSQGFDDGEGGAIYMRDGNLIAVDCVFTNDHAAPLGPDTGGGAIYINGSKRGVIALSCTFTGDEGANAGAVGALNAPIQIYDSLVTGNTATGHDANNNDPSKCSQMNNGQNEIGSGGNGGALYADGNDFDFTVCGDDIEKNAAGANAFGGGIFFTSDNMAGTLRIIDTTMTNNTGGHWTNVSTGSVTNAGTAVGTNAKQIIITNSTVQGVP
jgi:hypothetical protein